MQARGVPIDQSDVPQWARGYFSPEQLTVTRALLWVLLVYKCQGMDASRVNVAQRMHVHTIGKERKWCNPSVRSLAADLNLSENTVSDSVDDLVDKGFLLVTRRGNKRNHYQLAWPLTDCLIPPADGMPTLCGATKKKGGTCTWRAGRGTTTPGAGPCVQHGGTAASTVPGAPQPLRSLLDEDTLLIPQPLRPDPSGSGEDSTSTIADSHLNHCGDEPQPLRDDTSTVEAEYVSSALVSTSESSNPLVTAVGGLTVRTARAAQAPAAQPGDLFQARSVIAGIARYGTAPVWARRDHLVPLVAAALAAGFGRPAIGRYAQMVIAEGRFADKQHIPELRVALARLGRDVAAGHACVTCGTALGPLGCSCAPAEPAASADLPWSAEDQACWERVLAQLGVTDGDLGTDLDPAGTA